MDGRRHNSAQQLSREAFSHRCSSSSMCSSLSLLLPAPPAPRAVLLPLASGRAASYSAKLWKLVRRMSPANCSSASPTLVVMSYDTSSNVSSKKKTSVVKRAPAVCARISSTEGSCARVETGGRGSRGGFTQRQTEPASSQQHVCTAHRQRWRQPVMQPYAAKASCWQCICAGAHGLAPLPRLSPSVLDHTLCCASVRPMLLKLQPWRAHHRPYPAICNWLILECACVCARVGGG